MKLKLKQNICKVDQSDLGYYSINIIESNTFITNFKGLLEGKILKNSQFGDINNPADSFNEYGPFLMNEIDESDFKKLNFSELNSEIKEYYKDSDWGDDLPVFQKNFRLAISELNYLDLSSQDFYYINADRIDSKKIIEFNFYSYFVCIIATQKDSNQIITLTFAGD